MEWQIKSPPWSVTMSVLVETFPKGKHVRKAHRTKMYEILDCYYSSLKDNYIIHQGVTDHFIFHYNLIMLQLTVASVVGFHLNCDLLIWRAGGYKGWLARWGGVKKFSGLIYEEMQGVLKVCTSQPSSILTFTHMMAVCSYWLTTTRHFFLDLPWDKNSIQLMTLNLKGDENNQFVQPQI